MKFRKGMFKKKKIPLPPPLPTLLHPKRALDQKHYGTYLESVEMSALWPSQHSMPPFLFICSVVYFVIFTPSVGLELMNLRLRVESSLLSQLRKPAKQLLAPSLGREYLKFW